MQAPLLLSFVSLMFAAACTDLQPAPTETATLASVAGGSSATSVVITIGTRTGTVPAKVVNVVDGDTIDVVMDGRQYRVRYVGIDTPETVDPRRPVQPFGKQASERNKALVAGRTVYLEKDVSETDQFGRLLRYIWLDEDTMVNALLVSEGLAQAATYPPDVRYAERFVELQRLAREQGRGLWAVAGASTGAPAAAPTGPAGGECDPSYPTVCIPPPPPDLDCSEIGFRRFQVLPPDPHRFDSNGDGVGCEQ